MEKHQKDSGLVGAIADAQSPQVNGKTSSPADRDVLHENGLFRACFTDAALGLSITDLQGRFLEANPAYCAITGYSKAELCGLNVQTITHPDDLPATLTNVGSLIAGEIPLFAMEERYVRKDGIVVWVENSVSLTRDHNGRPLNLVRISQDISARKQLEDELRKAKEFSETLIQTANTMILGLDTNGKIRIFNRAAEQITGYSRQELKDKDWFKTLFPKERYPNVWVGFNQWVADGKTFESPILTKSGQERHILWHNNQVIVDGKVVATISFGTDVTERKETEAALRIAEQKYRDIFENAGDGIFQITPEGQYLAANPALARMHGYDSPEELISDRTDTSKDAYVDPARREEFNRLLESQGFVRGFEHQIFGRDGKKIWCSINARAVHDQNGAVRYCEGTAQDITERKRAEADLRESEELFSKAFHRSPAPLIITSLGDGRFLNANEAFLRAFEYQRAEVIGQTIGSLNIYIHANDRKKLIGDLQAQGALRGYESQARTKSGRILDLWVFVEPITLRGEQCILSTAYDITERKSVEEALRESEERYRDLVENSREFICTHDLAGKILSANRAATELLGYDPSELVGKKSIQDILAPEVRREFDEYKARLFKDGATSGVMLVQTKSGERRFWEYFNTLRTVGVATPIVRGMARDITEQRRAEQSLQLFRNLLDQSNDAIEVIDPTTLRFIDCNESACRALGYSREEFLALTIFDIDPSIDRAMIERLDEDMKESGFANFESIHVRKDGTTFPVEVNLKLVTLEANYRLAAVRDITRRRLTEEALRKSEMRYRELFENARDPIYVHDLTGRYTSVNRAAEELSGFSRAEIIGKHYSNFVAPPDLKHARTNLCRKLDEGKQTIYEVNVLSRSGRRIPVEVSSRLIFEQDVAVGVQGTARDITDRKRAQEALHIYSQRLIAAQEAEREKVARELHDEIGQVLTAVRINLQSIQRSRGANENARPLEESIAIVDEALGRVRELSIELRPALLDDLGLSAALRWYVDRYAQRTGIIAEVLNGSDEDVRLPRDLEIVCFRIAQEALTNVVRHAQAVSVSVQLERARDRMLLTIIDDGVGFDVVHLRQNAPAASALGLRGMEERALAVGGYLEIDSGVERGTRIRATFPLRRQ